MINSPTPHQGNPVFTLGKPLTEANGAMILLHGRGASAQNILELAHELPHPDLAYLAPQAQGYSWYPYSFLQPLAHNEPWLSSALQRVGELVAQVEMAGIPAEQIILAGFSQGACLAAEFAARNAQRYGGLLLFSGGLIGPDGRDRIYAGSRGGTPLFLGCSDVDPHIPLARVEETAVVLGQLQAQVTYKIYANMAHTIIEDELVKARQLLATMPMKAINRNRS